MPPMLRHAQATARTPIRVPGPPPEPTARQLAKKAAKAEHAASGHVAVAAQRRQLAESDRANAEEHLRAAEAHDRIAASFRAGRDPHAPDFVTHPTPEAKATVAVVSAAKPPVVANVVDRTA